MWLIIIIIIYIYISAYPNKCCSGLVVNCPFPTILENGIVTVKYSGYVIHYSCNPGYKRVGYRGAICIRNIWSHPKPRCVSENPENREVWKVGGKRDSRWVLGENTSRNKEFGLKQLVDTTIPSHQVTTVSPPLNKTETTDPCQIENGECAHKCKVVNDEVTCSCNNGFMLNPKDGKSCEDIDECASNFRRGPCSDTCINSEGSFKCLCTRSGTELASNTKTCQDIDECAIDNHGCSHTCTNVYGSAFCSCPAGYILLKGGKTCEDIDECKLPSTKCFGECVNVAGSYRCEEKPTTIAPTPSYTQNCYLRGLRRDENGRCIDINECENNNFGCSHTCLNYYGGAFCACPSGYRKIDSKTCEDINECNTYYGRLCAFGCINTLGSYICSCPPGFELGHRQVCRDINECATNNGGCSHTCVNQRGSMECRCPTGFELLPDKKSCRDINECLLRNPCHQRCINIDGGFKCACKPGHLLLYNDQCEPCRKNSYMLENEDSCKECPSHSHTDGKGKTSISHCLCNDGFEGDLAYGKPCTDIDECSINNFNCSDRCVNTPGGAHCACPNGYKLDLDDKTCIDIDECALGNGGCEHHCKNKIGTFECVCNENYYQDEGDIRKCIDVNECDKNNGGCSHYCENVIGDYQCKCDENMRLSADQKTCTSNVILLFDPYIFPLNGLPRRSVGISCSVKCSKGYELIGVGQLICIANGTWSDSVPYCSALTCPQLSKPKNGNVSPSSCHEDKTEVTKRCYYTCNKGYVLVGKATKVCKRTQAWSPEEIPFCQEDIPEPFIQCPSDIEVTLNPGEKDIDVELSRPITNMNADNIIADPKWGNSHVAKFSSGINEIMYTAKNPLSNQTASCVMSVLVKDEEQPKVDQCPENFEVEAGASKTVAVNWNEPIFTDNVGIERVWKSNAPGFEFGDGIHSIKYSAQDAVGNVVDCTFSVTSQTSRDNSSCSAGEESQNSYYGLICVKCPPGMHSDTKSICANCPVNYYSDTVGSSSCKPCPNGFKTASVGKGQSGLVIDPELRKFFGALEPYVSEKNDIVFVLDASGSIKKHNFPHEIKFTELVSRMFTVSADFTRVSVISYSNVVDVPIDYIKNSENNNMCTLLKDLKTVPYSGRNTNTAGALKESGNILKNARPDSNKIVLLISDGKSSKEYGAPIPVAQSLRTSGYIVFSIGVASINKDELLAVASSPQHIYMLKNFRYIVEVNDQLRNDTKELVWDAAEPDLCNSYCSAGQDCCDKNAACFCGTRGGRYECACQSGHQGNGHQGECKRKTTFLLITCLNVPFGSYKENSGKDQCKSCPKNSTTLKEGSTSQDDCVCITGHSGKPHEGEACKAVTCNKLSSPIGGQMFPTDCRNTYETVCTFSCGLGYCPYSCNATSNGQKAKPKDVEPRKCLESRVWSGPEFYCDKIICPALDVPLNGKYKCNSTDFGFFAHCNFTCDDGYTLIGSKQRKCQLNGKWTGDKTICKVKTCPRLKINKNLRVKPKHCSTKDKPFRTTCQYYCTKGFELQTPSGHNMNVGIRECLANGTWSGYKEAITCKDITPPTIKCPSDLSVMTDTHKATSSVSWLKPVASDNSWIKSVKLVYPIGIKGLSHHFPIGSTKFTYLAYDSVDLKATCSFSVKVMDNESPQVKNCPSDIEVFYHKKSGTSVSWTEPTFVDNSGKIKTSYQNRKPGQKFTWGPPALVIYNATDYSQNSASCSFKIKVKQYKCPYHPPPKHGSIVCDKWVEGQFCSVSCPESYDFAREPEKVYYCYQKKGSGEWGSLLGTSSFEFPWPDCAKVSAVSGVKLGLSSQYHVGSCPNSEEARKKIAENFIKILNDEFSILGICIPSDGCNIQNVNITCSSIPSTNSRQKRQINANNLLSVDYNMVLKPEFLKEKPSKTQNKTTPVMKIDTFVNSKINEIKLVGPAKLPDMTEYGLLDVNAIPNSVKITEKPKIFCELGSILHNNGCLQCPEGTYHDPISEICVDCPVGFYQNIPGSELCEVCPKGSTTLETNSKSVNECRKVCLEGTFSDTGFYPCESCPRGTYQPKQKQTSCISCKNGLTTLKEGAHIPQLCQDVDLCKQLMPCMNKGVCVRNGTDYSCSCLKNGYVGKNCETNENDCFPGLCLNNGTCIDRIGDYYCYCPSGFIGKNCEKDVDDCESQPCVNGGTCHDKTLGYECTCPKGFSGKQCEINFNDCKSSPCRNNGKCIDLNNDFRCCCPVDFYGKQCESIKDPCLNNKCANGGTCVANGTDLYTCNCPVGFSGDRCEIDLDDCENNPCKNGGKCIDAINSFSCICKPGYNGSTCESALPSDFDISFVGAYSSNYVKIKTDENMDAVTTIFWMKTNDKTSRGTPLSFSYKNSEGHVEENGLTFADYNKFLISLHGEIIRTEIIANRYYILQHFLIEIMFVNYRDTSWHVYVLTWDSTDGSWGVFVDGIQKYSGKNLAKNGKLWKGYFVLGQEQDNFGGGFSPTEAFVGEISQFNVWNYAMSAEEVKSISKQCNFYGNAVAWPDVLLNIHGDVTLKKPSALCLNKAKCTSGECHCSLNNDGDLCWRKINQCSSNSCLNGRKCQKISSGYFVCDCGEGLTGKLCQYDVDECEVQGLKCSHGCENTLGSYHCTCPTNHILHTDNHTCIERIHLSFLLSDETYCSFKGNYHLGEEITSVPGSCCPKCTPEPGICTIAKDNEFSTFDDMLYSFNGNCRYVLAEDCKNSTFKISVEFNSLKQSEKSLFLNVGCENIAFYSPSNISLNGSPVNLPLIDSNSVHISLIDKSSIQIKLYNDIKVIWESGGNVAIYVPINLKNRSMWLMWNLFTVGKLMDIGIVNGKQRKTFELKQKITNVEVKVRIENLIGEYEPLLETARRRKLQWFGHISRKPGSLAHTVMHGMVEGVRSRGKPKATWLKDISEWTGKSVTFCLKEAVQQLTKVNNPAKYSSSKFLSSSLNTIVEIDTLRKFASVFQNFEAVMIRFQEVLERLSKNNSY
ncbi:Sushi, von Willebrand factor type A, EGF and pentraxin domain-containing protein 1 [Nymphon striatum]|nr:Sushi, von Willebrand factor type A, EGF and pentraxin domain-containing protein 1 [Nymphon striatum]